MSERIVVWYDMKPHVSDVLNGDIATASHRAAMRHAQIPNRVLGQPSGVKGRRLEGSMVVPGQEPIRLHPIVGLGEVPLVFEKAAQNVFGRQDWSVRDARPRAYAGEAEPTNRRDPRPGERRPPLFQASPLDRSSCWRQRDPRSTSRPYSQRPT